MARNVYIIGLMSGTSLDGLDICYVKFPLKSFKNFEIIKAETLVYDEKLRNILQNAYESKSSSLMKLNSDLGKFFGKKILSFIDKHKITKIDLIASHGQTIFHNPDLGYTTQIGDGSYINSITKIKTISDFRKQDIALGGQGAPLVPIGDLLLFPEYKYCLNIGGFANISIKEKKTISAFDICPANIILNYYAKKTGVPYDEFGKIASKGIIHNKLLNELNSIKEYKIKGAKSFGWEFIEETILPIVDKYKISIPNILRTLTEHIAIQISATMKNGEVLITGGGVYNNFLIKRISSISKIKIIIPSDELINYKEALIFAFLGLLKSEDRINVLSSVTGAIKNHSSGIIFDAYPEKSEKNS